jgi:uncharacterized membrane protein
VTHPTFDESEIPAKSKPQVSPDPGGATPGADVTLQRQMLFAQMSAFSSPFPPPDLLEGYEKVKKGLSGCVIELITTEAAQRRKLQEDEAIHRRKLEESDQNAKHQDMRAGRSSERVGQIFALLVCLFIVGCGTFVILKGQPIAGTILGSGAAILGLVRAFLPGAMTGPSKNQSADPKGAVSALSAADQPIAK